MIKAIPVADYYWNRVNEVVEYIDNFKKVKDEFLNGLCYQFAVILCERFPEGIIMYLPVENHFVVDIHGSLYDASGCVTDEYFHSKVVPWEKMEEYDSLQHERIVKYCVNKEQYVVQ